MVTSEEFKEWLKLTNSISAGKKRELELRNKIIKQVTGRAIVDDVSVGEYLHTFMGKKLTLVIGETLSIDEDNLAIMRPLLTDDERKAIIYKPVLDKVAYNSLPDVNNLSMHCIIRKRSQPTLKEKK